MSDVFKIINDSKSWKNGDFPIPATVTLALGPHGSDGKGTCYLTQKLASAEEIDKAFDRLLKNLEVDRKEAKKILKNENERIKRDIGAP